MSLPNIPDIKPKIDIDREDAITLLLSSVALEEIGLAHILNAEGEKIQAVLNQERCKCANINDLLRMNESVERTVDGLTRMQMLLQMKLQDVLKLTTTTSTTTSTTCTCTRTTSTHSCTTTCTRTYTTTSSSTTTSCTCTKSCTTQYIPRRLKGCGEGYIVGHICGTAILKADLKLFNINTLDNYLRFTSRIKLSGQVENIELCAISSSLCSMISPDSTCLFIRGQGVLGGSLPEYTGLQVISDFCLQVSMGNNTEFRMIFKLSDDIDYDSGMVKVLVGDLQVVQWV